MKQISTYCLLLLSFLTCAAAQAKDGINTASLENAQHTYNYTSWDKNFLDKKVDERSFTNQTNAYNLNINYSKLSINNLSINNSENNASDAFKETKAETFNAYNTGDIDYKILQDGKVLHEKPSENPTNLGQKIGQMVEYGPWINRRVIDSLNYTGDEHVRTSYSGIEFANWHNRFRITFHLRPTKEIKDGQLQLAVEIPEAYQNKLHNENIYAFINGEQGFSVKGGITAATTTTNGQTITVTSAAMDLKAQTSYEISLIFYAIKADIKDVFVAVHTEESEITVLAKQTAPEKSKIDIEYKADEGIYFITIPSHKMGYGSEKTIDLMQNIKLQLSNEQNADRRVRLSFRDEAPQNVVGFSSMLRDENNEPTGFPLQIAKNWHDNFKMLYSGSWIHEYTELIIPANSELNLSYTRVGARWGKVFGAFSHQLCVVGAGVPRGGWLEAGLGAFAENITHSPDYEYGRSNICDYRPFLVNNQYAGGKSRSYGWTGNLGGMDVFVYVNDKGERIYPSEVKTRFHRYGPNLSKTSISSLSGDEKLKLDYTFYLNRSDDYLRVYYKLKVKVLEDAAFSRFDIFQVGADNYNLLNARELCYGNNEGLTNTFIPSKEKKVGYSTPATALEGTTPWLLAGDAVRSKTTNFDTKNIDANNGLIIRDYKALINGQESNTPFFREFLTQNRWATETVPTYCLVAPEGITRFSKGDSIEMLIELCLLPKDARAYYGPNEAFRSALQEHGKSWKMLYREIIENDVEASSEENEINANYPLTVATTNNTATVNVKGGIGYVPIVFSGLSHVTNPKLWKIDNGKKTLVDQSNYGQDFWQADYNTETGLFDLIYNVNQDSTTEETTYKLEIKQRNQLK